MSPRPSRDLRQQLRQLKITRGALIVLVAEVVLSLLWVIAAPDLRGSLATYLIATPANVFEHGRVWTLVTSPLIELDFVALVLSILILWMFVPTLERFWGTNRFFRFTAITSIAGSLGGVLVAWALGGAHMNEPISGLQPFVWAAVIAFGITHARQPVEFSFYIRMTGRQLMYGFLAFLVLFVTLQQIWAKGASFAAAIAVAAIMVSKKWSPGLAWRRYKLKRARAKLSVLDGGAKPARKRADEKYLN